MRTRTRGIQLNDDGSRTLNQVYKGQRIFERLGKVSQADAEAELRRRRDDIAAQELRNGAERVWADGARKYLIECQQRKARSLDTIAYHVDILLPYIGDKPMWEVCTESLEEFINDRLDEGVKNATVNRSLEVVRTVTNRAARVWRDRGKPWIGAAPLIEMLDEAAQARAPRPISWAEQAKLLPRLPDHLAEMVDFTVNTGARDENVCGLRWEWERPVPELKRSVFVIPPEYFKTNRSHVLVLNDRAWDIAQRQRGRHPDYVFVYRRERVKNLDLAPAMQYHRIGTMNTNAYQAGRKAAGLETVRVHDLRHTYGQRLRDAGVSKEDRALLLGHAVEDMPEHYATATVARLLDAANSVAQTRDRTTLLRIVNG
ncbi:tyrosine-type recombinase/integrase [Hydrogenophaga sp. ANAO-22]|jgi:integrase|uniref:tyrosine-type recombinase/integrase n=1 Tax=Hydrogenophaga sp. ANAO-22 TaxID=3166645 RepID=UPI0036D24EA5